MSRAREQQRTQFPSAVIKKWLDRELDDWEHWKDYTHDELDAKMEQLPVKPPIWHALDLHQKVCFLIGVETGNFLFILDMGMGKTLLSIAIARYLLKLGEIDSALVLVPNKSNKSSWKREILKHSPSTSFCVLSGSSKAKWEQLESGRYTLVIETYAGLMKMVTELLADTRKKKSKKRRLVPDPKAFRKLKKIFQAMFMDECTKVANKGKLPWRIARQVAKDARYRYGLTGTPFGRDPTPIWGQMYIIDKGETLGPTLGFFRAVFFSAKDLYFGGTEYTFRKTMSGELHRILRHRSITYMADEGDLPELRPIKRYPQLPMEASAYYEKAKASLIAAQGNYEEMRNSFLRMRQISSGFLGYTNDETGERAKYVFPVNPKLEYLLDDLDEVVDQAKAIVFHEFIFSGDTIERELLDMGIPFIRIRAGAKESEIDAAFEAFDNDPKYRVLVINNAIGAMGHNLQVARYTMYYESPVSYIIRKQSERRSRRQYSPHKSVFRYDYLVRGTEDENILAFHAEGEDLFARIIEGIKRPTSKAGLGFESD